jgi:signal transduction histidine kinase
VESSPKSTRKQQKQSTLFNRWGYFLLFFTPVYIAIAWLILKSGSDILNLEESFRFLIAFILLTIYIITGISNSAPTSPLDRISKTSSNPKVLDPNLLNTRNKVFTDEIDILVESMLKMQKNLKEKNAELIESREKMQELARTTLRAQEVERRYISRELHDQAGQLLVSLRYTVKALLTDLPPATEAEIFSSQKHNDLNDRLSSMLTQIDKTLETVRALSHKMRPALLDVGDINLAMQEYCSEFQEGKRINIEYQGAPLPYIAEDTAIALFRFLQESLTNVLKHADANHVWVQLTSENGWVQMTVEDNGRGEITTPGQKGIGIMGMKERFLLLGGTVEAQPGKVGFSITAKAPLSRLPRS